MVCVQSQANWESAAYTAALESVISIRFAIYCSTTQNSPSSWLQNSTPPYFVLRLLFLQVFQCQDMGHSMPSLLPLAFYLWWPWSLPPTRSPWDTRGASKMRCACLSNQYMTGILVQCFKNTIDACRTVFSILQVSQGLWDISPHADWLNGVHTTFQNSAGEKSERDSTGFALQLLRRLPFRRGLQRWGHLFLLLVAASIFWYIDVFPEEHNLFYLSVYYPYLCLYIYLSIHSSIHPSGIGSRSHRGCHVKCPTVNKLEQAL